MGKDTKKCEGEIEKMGTCKEKKDVCCAPKTPKPTKGPEGTKGPQPTKGPEGTKSPKPTKGPEGTKGPKPTKGPEGTKGPQPTDKPKPQKCEKLGGKCISKKDTKKCEGEIEKLGTCKEKKDVCCAPKTPKPTKGPEGTKGPQPTKGPEGTKGPKPTKGP